MSESIDPRPRESGAHEKHEKQEGKVGLAILLWLLGVPGSIVVLYLIFGH